MQARGDGADEKSGLQSPIGMFKVEQLPGALLCNTGNVMARHSEHFRAGCHWVQREAATADQTRVSLVFFYDQAGSKTGGC